MAHLVLTVISQCGDKHSIFQGSSVDVSCAGLVGRYVFVGIPGISKILTLCEVEVTGSSPGQVIRVLHATLQNAWLSGLGLAKGPKG